MSPLHLALTGTTGLVFLFSSLAHASEKNTVRSAARRYENCAKVVSIRGNSCEELEVQLDVTVCGDPKRVVRMKVKCEGDAATATYRSPKFDYRVAVDVKKSWWGGPRWELAGDVARSRRALPRSAPRPEEPAPVSVPAPPPTAPFPEIAMDVTPPSTDEEVVEDKNDRVLAYLRDLVVKGSVDMYYAINFNGPAQMTAVPTPAANGAQNAYRVFDVYHDSMQLAYAHILLQKPTEPVGFVLDLGYGPSMQAVSGALTDASQTNVKQASLSYKNDLGFTFEAGRFVTHVGYEVIEASDNWNYSRGVLFGYFDPFWHQGIKMSYSPNEAWTTSVLWVNGWNNSYEFNGDKNIGLQVVGTLSDSVSMVANVLTGQEPSAVGLSGGERKTIYDLIFSYKASEDLAFASNLAHLSYDASGGLSATGLALFARLALTEDWSLSPRAEIVLDRQNLALGGSFTNGQILRTYTLTLENRLSANLAWRGEARMDKSTEDAFLKNGVPKSFQETLTFALLGSF